MLYVESADAVAPAPTALSRGRHSSINFVNFDLKNPFSAVSALTFAKNSH